MIRLWDRYRCIGELLLHDDVTPALADLSESMPVSDPASFKGLSSYLVTCGSFSGDPADAIEEYAPGSSGLLYQGDGNWQFNWKTPKTYARQCRVMVLTLGDNSTHTAQFKFK